MPILLLALALANTQPDTTARKHYERAEKLYALGKFQDALAEYEAAYEARPLPGFLFNIGQCHRNLGDYKQAVFSFKKYLADKPDAKNRDAVEDLIAELEKKIAAEERKPKPRLDVQPEPAPPPRDLTVAPPPAPEPAADHPFYTRWWFWTIVGVAAVGAGVGIWAATSSNSGGVPETGFGNIDFPR